MCTRFFTGVFLPILLFNIMSCEPVSSGGGCKIVDPNRQTITDKMNCFAWYRQFGDNQFGKDTLLVFTSEPEYCEKGVTVFEDTITGPKQFFLYQIRDEIGSDGMQAAECEMGANFKNQQFPFLGMGSTTGCITPLQSKTLTISENDISGDLQIVTFSSQECESLNQIEIDSLPLAKGFNLAI